jgi:hypothetical protein
MNEEAAMLSPSSGSLYPCPPRELFSTFGHLSLGIEHVQIYNFPMQIFLLAQFLLVKPVYTYTHIYVYTYIPYINLPSKDHK